MKTKTVRARIHHRADLGAAVAKAQEIEARVKAAWSRVKTAWRGDRLEFEYPLRRSSVTGSIRIAAGMIEIELTGPLLVVALHKAKGLEILAKHVSEALGRDVINVEHD